MTTELSFVVVGEDREITVSLERLVIAGYTGRDQAAVQAHVDELARIGVPPPPQVPMFYEIPVGLLTADPAIAVATGQTSGEVEPVLVRAPDAVYVAVGSDHTDREVEKRDVAKSKASAPKPVSTSVIALAELESVWDRVEIACRVDGRDYQRGPLAELTAPGALLAKMRAAGDELDVGTAMFCGTVPLLSGGFVFGSRYELELGLPDGRSLRHAYDVTSPRSRADAQA